MYSLSLDKGKKVAEVGGWEGGRIQSGRGGLGGGELGSNENKKKKCTSIYPLSDLVRRLRMLKYGEVMHHGSSRWDLFMPV